MAVLTVVGIVRLVRAERERRVLQNLTEAVSTLRFSADSCSAALDAGQTRLIGYRQRLDSLHDAVREFEAADPHGVAAEQYDEYMNAFALYRDSVAAWDGRVAALQGRLRQCQSLAREHNAAVDSLRAARAVPGR